MSIDNHEVKNTASDKPGFLIDKFSSTGRIVITTYVDPFSHKISFKLNMNTKDLFEHLLKPTTTFSYVECNTAITSSTRVMISPVVFPNGFMQSITFAANDYSKVTSFEIACYGNEENSIIGAKQWFYVHSASMTYDGETSYEFNKANPNADDVVYSIVPYSFNFVAVKLTLAQGCEVLANVTNDFVARRLLAVNSQFDTDIDLRSTKTIPDNITKYNSEVVPFIQFNLLKA